MNSLIRFARTSAASSRSVEKFLQVPLEVYPTFSLVAAGPVFPPAYSAGWPDSTSSIVKPSPELSAAVIILSVISAGVGIALRFSRLEGRQAEETGKRHLRKIFQYCREI